MSDSNVSGSPGNSDFYAQLSEQERQRFDEPGLLKRVRGREDRAARLVSGFIENFSTTYLANLTAAIQAQDYTNVQLHSHSIKGAGANLGADKLSEVAANLEQFARNQQDFSQINDLMHALQNEFVQFKELVQRRFGI